MLCDHHHDWTCDECIQAARLDAARAIWRWCYDEVQYEYHHIAGPDTSYGYGVRGVTAALLGKFGQLSTDEAMAKIIGESVGGDAIAGRLDSEAAAVHVSVGEEVSGIDEAGESIGQSSEPATPSADATPPAQAAESPRPVYDRCPLCGELGHASCVTQGQQAERTRTREIIRGLVNNCSDWDFNPDGSINGAINEEEKRLFAAVRAYLRD
jgi:hypothetical protein